MGLGDVPLAHLLLEFLANRADLFDRRSPSGSDDLVLCLRERVGGEFGGYSGRCPSVNLSLGSARGGRRVPAEPLMIEIVRALRPDDLPLLRSPPPVGASTPTVQKLSHSHHQLAQMMASGRPDAETSLVTGYSISRISILRKDPAFGELLAHYASQKELAFVDVLERLKSLGLDSVEELQERLATNPDSFTKRDLMDLVKLGLIEGRAGPGSRQGAGASGGPGAASPAVNVQVQFVTADHRPMVEGKSTETTVRALR